ncbi:hypothetical protein BDR05DRAFT_950761 [Suillus weaverae]|nr:hypothetical protein BDR05DRAFT_950761 [Suillus weaverae]
MPEMTCPACNKKLASITSYSQHLARTSNPACHALYLSSQDFNPPPTEPNSPQFKGEYFGMDNDLEWQGFNEQMNINDCDDPIDEEHSDDGRDDDGFNKWEPPPAQESRPACPNGDESDDSELPHVPDMPEEREAQSLATLDDGGVAFVRACAEAGIKPIIHPFWEPLPLVNIFESIMPDILHQLYQGLVKHLLAWLSDACSGDEIDARCRCLPPNHHIRHFVKGITTLSRLSGTEHRQICQFLLGIIIDIRLPNNMSSARLLRAVRGLLDFLYITQYPCHSSETLVFLNEALELFHKNKDIFVDLGIRNSFNLPKLHFALHYTHMIRTYGTTDNYNTESTERLHIDLAKDAYRSTNHKNEFIQMAIWLERREKILCHEKYIQWKLGGTESYPGHQTRPPDMLFCHTQVMTKHPTVKVIIIDKIKSDYGALYFRKSLARYIAKAALPVNATVTPVQLEHHATNVHIPFQKVPVFHKVKWVLVDIRGHGDPPATVNSVHARPGWHSGKFASNDVPPPRFDTVWASRHQGVSSCTGPGDFFDPSQGHLHAVSIDIPPSEASSLCRVVLRLSCTQTQSRPIQSLAHHCKWATLG